METPIITERAEYEVPTVKWRDIDLEIRFCPCWLATPGDEFVTQHIEIRSSDKCALPITETGYRSHFVYGAEALAEFNNDPVEFVLWWLNQSAKAKAWLEKVEAGRQHELF